MLGPNLTYTILLELTLVITLKNDLIRKYNYIFRDKVKSASTVLIEIESIWSLIDCHALGIVMWCEFSEGASDWSRHNLGCSQYVNQCFVSDASINLRWEASYIYSPYLHPFPQLVDRGARETYWPIRWRLRTTHMGNSNHRILRLWSEWPLSDSS